MLFRSASTVISKLKQNNSDIEYSCVGGVHLNSLGVKSIYDLKEDHILKWEDLNQSN